MSAYTGTLISDLNYINYATNRKLSPEISPERWAAIYGSQSAEFEKRYQEAIRARS